MFNISTLGNIAGVGSLIAGFSKLSSEMIGVAKSSLQMYSHFEQTENGLIQMLQSTEKGKELFEDLRSFSFETTFGVDELADASKQLLQVGVSVKDLKEQLKMVGDLAGGEKAKFNELVAVYTKVLNTGRAGSRELMQFQMKGIPLRQQLEKMGVVGTASAEQITEAFRQLTAEGGQFNNAMDRIIDTIEGKEGFVSDTFKELLVNFAEASGLADAYKVALDLVYNAIQGITDLLAEINQDPMAQALFRGALVGIIVGIGGAITSVVVPALITTIGKLSTILALQTAINPTKALIGLGVGAVAGIGTYILSQKKLAEIQVQNVSLVDEMTVKIKEQTKQIIEYRNEIDKLSKDDLLFSMTLTLGGQTAIQKAKSELNEIEEKIKALNPFGANALNYNERKTQLESEKKALEDLIGEMTTSAQKGIDRYNELVNADRQKTIQSIRDAYERTEEGQKKAIEEQIKYWESLLDAKHTYYELTEDGQFKETSKNLLYYAEYVKAIIEDLKNKLKDGVATGQTSYYEQLLAEKKLLEMNNEQREIQRLQKMENLGAEVETVRQLEKQIELLKSEDKILAKITQNKKDALDKGGFSGAMSYLGNSMNELGYGLMNGSDIGNFVAGLGNGNKGWQVVIDMFVNSVAQVVGGIDGVTTVLSPLVNTLKQFEPIIKTTFLIVYKILSPIEELANIIMTWLDNITGGWFTEMANEYDRAVNTISDATDKVADELGKLTSYIKAMNEQEQYYLQKKQQINSDVYTSGALKSVNDMILTPNGNFSTHPNDYIIATKNPESLASSTVLQPIINDYAGNNIEVRQETDGNGITKLFVEISKKIASDVSNGSNGWDMALKQRENRLQGRRVTL